MVQRMPMARCRCVPADANLPVELAAARNDPYSCTERGKCSLETLKAFCLKQQSRHVVSPHLPNRRGAAAACQACCRGPTASSRPSSGPRSPSSIAPAPPNQAECGSSELLEIRKISVSSKAGKYRLPLCIGALVARLNIESLRWQCRGMAFHLHRGDVGGRRGRCGGAGIRRRLRQPRSQLPHLRRSSGAI